MPDDAEWREWRGQLRERISHIADTMAQVNERLQSYDARLTRLEHRVWMAAGGLGALTALAWLPEALRRMMQ